MPLLDQNDEHILSNVYCKTQSDVLQLKSRLPKDAVGVIIDEVLSRVRTIGSTHGRSVDHPPPRVVEKLCYALISSEADEGVKFIDALRDEGASLEAIYLAYLAEAARILGDWWVEDHVTFVEVSIGTSRIYSIMRGMSHLFVPTKPIASQTAVFASVPGETHIVGIRMAADLLGKKGWDINLYVGLSHGALLDSLTGKDCHIIGLSAGGVHSASVLARLVFALRLSNPTARILVSGQIVHEAPELLALMGLDAVVNDVESALVAMNLFLTDAGTSGS